MRKLPLKVKASNRKLKKSEKWETREGNCVQEGNYIPWNPKEVNHNGMKVVFSDLILSAERVGKLHWGQNSIALQSL